MLQLAPEVETLVRQQARAEGLTESDYIARLVKDKENVPKPKDVSPPSDAAAQAILLANRHRKSDGEIRAAYHALLALPREEIIRRNAASIAYLNDKIAEAEDATPEEIAVANAAWEAHKRSMNDNRRLTGERLLYPEVEEEETAQP